MKNSLFQLLRNHVLFIVFGLSLSFIFRILFYFTFGSIDSSGETKWAVYAFMHGLRFDLSALFFLNSIFFLFSYFKVIRLNSYFLNSWAFVTSVYGFLLIADFTYYSLYGSRIGWDFLAVFNGLNLKIFISMIFEFVILIPLVLLVFYLNRLVLKKLFFNLNFDLKPTFYPIYFFLILLVSVIVIRGGFQKRVLSPQHTWLYSNGNAFYAQMTSNSFHNLMRSKKESVIPKHFEKSIQTYLKDWSHQDQKTDIRFERKPKNILFIFIESWSSYSYENGKMPKLESWINTQSNHVYFSTHFYSNGNLSKDALLSIFFGLPSYFNVHFFESKYAKNKLIGIGQLAKEKSMDSFFLHAAPAGTQFFDVISKAAGFETYKSIIDGFSGDENLRGTWGVHDEALYQASFEYISKLKNPFLGTLFTTSTHTPFQGTPNNKDNGKDQEFNYFSAIEYADKSLVDFLNEAAKKDWYKDTLFVVTGDHSPPLSTNWNRSLKEQSRIPLLMYWPGSNIGKETFRKIGRHVDIPKTVFDIFEIYPKSWTPYGQSIIRRSDSEPQVFYTNSNSLNLVKGRNQIVTQPLIDDDSKFESLKLSMEESKKIKEAYFELKDYVYRLEKNEIYK